MARAMRIALDAALVSLKTVRPVVTNLWNKSKNVIANTSARSLVCNTLVNKTENFIERTVNTLEIKMTNLRDRQFPKEIEYLEKELQKVKNRNNEKCSASKAVKPAVGTAWQYAKIEIIPPYTTSFFHGSAGKNMEVLVSSIANKFILFLENLQRNIDAQQERMLRKKEAAIRAAQEKLEAEAKKAEKQAKEKMKKTKEAKDTEKKAETKATSKKAPEKK